MMAEIVARILYAGINPNPDNSCILINVAAVNPFAWFGFSSSHFVSGAYHFHTKDWKDNYRHKSNSIAGSGAHPLAADRCQICKTPPRTQSLANRKYVNPLCHFVGPDDLEHSNLLLDHAGAGVSGSGIPDADLYHLSRLRTRFVLQIAEGQ